MAKKIIKNGEEIKLDISVIEALGISLSDGVVDKGKIGNQYFIDFASGIRVLGGKELTAYSYGGTKHAGWNLYESSLFSVNFAKPFVTISGCVVYAEIGNGEQAILVQRYGPTTAKTQDVRFLSPFNTGSGGYLHFQAIGTWK